MAKKEITLEAFVKKCGSVEAAAAALKVSYFTLTKNWLKKKVRPLRLAKIELAKKGISSWWK
jgi:hypothetical protein